MCPYSAFLCTKFQGNGIMFFCFMTTFTPWWKWRNPANFQKVISQKYLVKFGMWGDDFGQHFHCKNCLDFIKVLRRYVYMKIALLFFLLITHGCGEPGSWATRHTTMCLDMYLHTGTSALVDRMWYTTDILRYVTDIPHLMATLTIYSVTSHVL